MDKILVVGTGEEAARIRLLAAKLNQTVSVCTDIEFMSFTNTQEPVKVPITPYELFSAPPQFIEPIRQSKHHNSKTKKRKPKTKKTHRK